MTTETTTGQTARTPFARKKPPLDLGHFGRFEIGKLTQSRQDTLEALGEELTTLQTAAQSTILPRGTSDDEVQEIRELGRDVRRYEDTTPEDREAEAARVKAAEEVLEARYVEIICEQIQTMLIVRDETTRQMQPAAEHELAPKLIRAYREPGVPEDEAVGLDELVAALEDVMATVDEAKAQGNG